jgi:phosphate transport system protein
MSDDYRRGFHEQLEEIKADVTRMAATVIETIPRATQVLLDADLEGADYLILADDELDVRSLSVEERCYELLALQSPVARDLRRVVAAVKMIGEIERSGDLAVNICKAARRMYGNELDPKLRGIVGRMSEQAQQLFRFAVDAYVEEDVPLAVALDDMDDMLDRLQVEFISQIFESHAAMSIPLQVAVQLALVARFYERIGDHAVNIGERVAYMVTGWLPTNEGKVRSQIADDGHDRSTATSTTSPEGSEPAEA